MKKSKNCLIYKMLVTAIILLPAFVNAQETTATTEPAPEKEYIRAVFENGAVINNQTTQNVGKKSLDFMLQHRFGIIENDDDLFGLFAPANIRMGLNYGFTDRLSVGLGATKNKMQYDFQGKYNILRQTKGKGMPVTVAYYGDMAKSSKPSDDFKNTEGEYKNAYRFSYFHEIMISRKMNSKLSLQLAGTFSYFNLIDSAYGQHAFYGMAFAGRYKFSPQSSVVVDFGYPLNVSGIEEDYKPLPNLGIGYEVSTGSHQFQIFVCNADGIINQDINVYNRNDFFKGDIMLGFNITRQWGFNK